MSHAHTQAGSPTSHPPKKKKKKKESQSDEEAVSFYVARKLYIVLKKWSNIIYITRLLIADCPTESKCIFSLD